jgi:hypothetical protein
MASISAEQRKKHGIGSTGKFPVFSQSTCISAVKLRHHGSGISASRVLAHASSWANRNNNSACKAAIKRAREADKKK